MRVKRLFKILIFFLCIQALIIGLLSSIIFLDKDEVDVQYNSSPMIIQFTASGGWGGASYLQIHLDGYYTSTYGRINENRISGYLEDILIEEIFFELVSNNISQYNKQRYDSNATDVDRYNLFFYNPESQSTIECTGYIVGVDTPDDLWNIFIYLYDLFWMLRT